MTETRGGHTLIRAGRGWGLDVGRETRPSLSWLYLAARARTWEPGESDHGDVELAPGVLEIGVLVDQEPICNNLNEHFEGKDG